ncbi:MAG: bifunctional folylpolyglutamate synthase/dihydrofolate synthase [Proteobacteria bacterium]|nr:bifunctional folylpolyglutamate synthase/dihydrofolate synthase [Pseudomonadota bacterium]
MDYDQALEYLDSLQPTSMRLELGSFTEACHIMGDPQHGLKTVHIGGTNGKGSTAAFLASILKRSGYRVGLYTSPHLMDVRERLQIDRELIGTDELAGILGGIKRSLPDERMLTYFETLTLASFICFKKSGVDIAVYETGMGGKLDATNLVEPLAVVITPISLDHTRHLGATIREIAVEKCGIIKRGVPTVVAYQPPEVMETIRRACDDAGSPLVLATPDTVTSKLGLAGEHQRQNAACAVETAEILSASGFAARDVEAALAETRWPGRLEVVHERPRVILDGAHNVAGAETLASYVRGMIPRERAVLIVGILADKDVAGIMRQLAPLFREVVCVRAPSDRAASPKDLAAAARSSGVTITMADEVPLALEKTMRRMGDDDTLVVSGSLTVVGKAEDFFSHSRKEVR